MSKSGIVNYVNLRNVKETLTEVGQSLRFQFDTGNDNVIASNLSEQAYNIAMLNLTSNNISKAYDSVDRSADRILKCLADNKVYDYKNLEFENYRTIGEDEGLPGAEEVIRIYTSIPEKAWNVWEQNDNSVKDLHDKLKNKFHESINAVYDAIQDNKELLSECVDKMNKSSVTDYDESFKIGFHWLSAEYSGENKFENSLSNPDQKRAERESKYKDTLNSAEIIMNMGDTGIEKDDILPF